MNAIDLLKSDHQDVQRLLEKGEETTNRAVKTRMALLQDIKEKLAAHEAVEEKIFYPAMLKKDKKRILEAYEEHHVVDNIMAELENTDLEDERWAAKFTVLKEMIEHHVQEEEKELFPEAKTMLGKEELEQLGAQMEKLKSQLIQ